MSTKAKENFESLMNKYASERGFTWNQDGDRYQSMLLHFNVFKLISKNQWVMHSF